VSSGESRITDGGMLNVSDFEAERV
jgi:hypothetical protein